MARLTRAFISFGFTLALVVTAWVSPQAASSPQGRGGGGGGQARASGPPAGARPSPPAAPGHPTAPGAPPGARDSTGHTITGTATPSTGNIHVNPCCGGHGGYYGGYYPYYPYYPYYYPWAFGLSFGWGWYGAYGAPYGYYYPGYSDASGSEEGHPSAPTHEMGDIRLKASPDNAAVYVDGVMVGKAGDFGGLTSHHLVLERGSHELELRADGYVTSNRTIKVEASTTMTERMTLQKK